MKTLNRSEIMKNAWSLYRQGGLTWSEALKQAWVNYNISYFTSDFISNIDKYTPKQPRVLKQRMCLQTATKHQYFYAIGEKALVNLGSSRGTNDTDYISNGELSEISKIINSVK
jgi:hypothetical protein